MKESLESFPNDPGFRMAVLAVGNAICSIPASARRRDARGFGTKFFQKQKISCIEASGLMAPSAGSIARAGKKFSGKTGGACNFPNFIHSTLFITKSLVGNLIGCANASRV